MDIAPRVLTLVIVAAVTHTPESGGSWLLKIILAAIPLRILLGMLLPPVLETGTPQPRLTVVTSAIACAFTVFTIEFIVFGWAHVALGASRQELAEHLQMLSLPLGWVSSRFVITPDKSFADVCGTILGNSFFYGIPMFVSYKVVRWAFNRSCPTQIGITGILGEDDEEK